MDLSEILGAGFIWVVLPGLHVFGVMRFIDHAKSLSSGSRRARGPMGGLIGFLGMCVLGIGILSVWGSVVLAAIFILAQNDRDGLYAPLIAFLAFPIAHLVAEMLINVGFEDT